jgi:hypothetical protein
MTYTINGKEWTEFDINERCAELMAHEVVNYCRSAHYAWTIIDKCWDELMQVLYVSRLTNRQWDFLIKKHNCTKLVAACICYIEINSI